MRDIFNSRREAMHKGFLVRFSWFAAGIIAGAVGTIMMQSHLMEVL